MCDQCYTPDLTLSYTPNPKPAKKVKIPTTTIKAGDKTNEWTEARNELKTEFSKMKITECELKYKGCWKDNALSFAHSKKRRKFVKGDIKKVCLACVPCHDILEAKPAEQMEKIVLDIIKKRKK